jgi:hypothetical protein
MTSCFRGGGIQGYHMPSLGDCPIPGANAARPAEFRMRKILKSTEASHFMYLQAAQPLHTYLYVH